MRWGSGFRLPCRRLFSSVHRAGFRLGTHERVGTPTKEWAPTREYKLLGAHLRIIFIVIMLSMRERGGEGEGEHRVCACACVRELSSEMGVV